MQIILSLRQLRHRSSESHFQCLSRQLSQTRELGAGEPGELVPMTPNFSTNRGCGDKGESTIFSSAGFSFPVLDTLEEGRAGKDTAPGLAGGPINSSMIFDVVLPSKSVLDACAATGMLEGIAVTEGTGDMRGTSDGVVTCD